MLTFNIFMISNCTPKYILNIFSSIKLLSSYLFTSVYLKKYVK